jgi:hypothetical protein
MNLSQARIGMRVQLVARVRRLARFNKLPNPCLGTIVQVMPPHIIVRRDDYSAGDQTWNPKWWTTARKVKK